MWFCCAWHHGFFSSFLLLLLFFPQAFDDFNTKCLEPCPNCGRTFVPRALEVHLRSCKPRDPSASTRRQPLQQNKVAKAPSVKQEKQRRAKEAKTPSPTTEEEEAPSKTRLAQMVRQSPALERADARRRLEEFINQMDGKVAAEE